MGREWDIDTFIHQLSTKYVTYFDVYRDEPLGHIPLAFMAMYKRSDQKYMVSKKVKVWGVQNQQYIFVARKDEPVTTEFINELGQQINKRIDTFIPADKEHMSTIFLGVIITNHAVDNNVKKQVKKYRKLKFMNYGLHGWAEVYIAIVDLEEGSILINKKGKQFVDSITQMLKVEE